MSHTNVLKHCVLRQKYLRYEYLGLLIECANDAEIYRQLQNNFSEQVKIPFNFYKAEYVYMTCYRSHLLVVQRWDVIIRFSYKVDAFMLKLFSQVI